MSASREADDEEAVVCGSRGGEWASLALTESGLAQTDSGTATPATKASETTPQSWHAPICAWSFGPYFIAVVAISVILTPMFNAARGSLLVAALFHFQMNGPSWPDAQPWDTLVFVIAAVVIVLLNRKTMLTHEGAVTEVLMPGEEGGFGGRTRLPTEPAP